MNKKIILMKEKILKEWDNILKYGKSNAHILKFAQKNVRYLIVLSIFFLVVFVNLPEKEKDNGKAPEDRKKIYALRREMDSPDLGDGKTLKEYQNIFSSRQGEYYRLGFLAESSLDEKLAVSVATAFGEKTKIGEVEVRGDSKKGSYHELIFQSDKDYSDLIFERMNGSDDYNIFDIDDDSRRMGVYLSGLSMNKLAIKNEQEKNLLNPTVFGQIETQTIFTLENSNNFSSLNEKGKEVSGKFEANGDFIAFVDIAMEKVDYGAEGKYQMEIGQCNGDEKIENPFKIKFSSLDLKKNYLENGVYRFDTAIKTEKGKTYCVAVSNINDKGYDKNGFEFGMIDGDNNKNTAMKLTLLDFAESEKWGRMLSNSKVEDVGDSLLYSYEISGGITDFFDVFGHGKQTQFDWEKKRMMANELFENYYMYRFDTGAPFSGMRIKAEQLDVDPKQIGIAYSFDKENWKELKYVQEKDGPQKFDGFIEGNGKDSVVFVKVFFKGEKENKKRLFGLKEFEVSAIIRK